MTEKDLVTLLKTIGLPVRYSHFTAPQELPYLVYLGNGQDVFAASDSVFWKENAYTIEYYFEAKDPDLESDIEDTLAGAEIIYEKSEDVWIEDEGCFVIYYYI